jgi:hypothetical protein
MIISRAWCSEHRQPGEEMFSNTGFATMAAIGKELEGFNLIPVEVVQATANRDPEHSVTHYDLKILAVVDPAPGVKPRQPFWQWYLENKPNFSRPLSDRVAAHLQHIEDETQMDPEKVFA